MGQDCQLWKPCPSQKREIELRYPGPRACETLLVDHYDITFEFRHDIPPRIGPEVFLRAIIEPHYKRPQCLAAVNDWPLYLPLILVYHGKHR